MAKDTRSPAQKLFHKKIGQYLKSQRETTGLTQKDMSEEMDYSTPQYVSNIERGLTAPSRPFMKTAIRLYKIPKAKLVHFMSQHYVDYMSAELT